MKKQKKTAASSSLLLPREMFDCPKKHLAASLLMILLLVLQLYQFVRIADLNNQVIELSQLIVA